MNLTKILIAAAALALTGGHAWAATVDGLTRDTLLFSADLSPSDPGTEVAALCDFLESDADGSCGLDIDYQTKFGDGSAPYSLAFNYDASEDYYYIDVSFLNPSPGWFVLKIGNGLPGETHYFYENVPEMGYLVWAASDLPAMDGCLSTDSEGLPDGTCGLSHITTVVPLPAAGFLLIGGLGGLMALRRRKS